VSKFTIRGARGDAKAIGGVAIDITERVQMEGRLKEATESLVDADQRKDEFIAMLAHELRNPLTPIFNAVHVLRRDASTLRKERDLALLSMIDRQLQHLIRLVDDLLDVSRITRGKIKLKKQRIDLANALRNAVDAERPTIERAGLDFRVTLPSETLMLDAEPVRIAQVFTNLLNNAAKYTEQGGAISLTAERCGKEAVITVSDTGVGIPAEMLPRVFDLFTQVDRSVGHAQDGLGIGLALVKSLLGLHGGTVEAQSEGSGRGSAFIVRLPLLSQSRISSASEIPSPNTFHTSRRILVIDDNPDVANSLAMLLETFGAIVRVAYSGAEGLALVGDFRPELVFLDLGMPEMDGYETARRIRALPEGRDMKLVALTGWGKEQIHDRVHEAGFTGQITKPAGLDALRDLLAT
jgi:CheY-like chemotaxis protein